MNADQIAELNHKLSALLDAHVLLIQASAAPDGEHDHVRVRTHTNRAIKARTDVVRYVQDLTAGESGKRWYALTSHKNGRSAHLLPLGAFADEEEALKQAHYKAQSINSTLVVMMDETDARQWAATINADLNGAGEK